MHGDGFVIHCKGIDALGDARAERRCAVQRRSDMEYGNGEAARSIATAKRRAARPGKGSTGDEKRRKAMALICIAEALFCKD